MIEPQAKPAKRLTYREKVRAGMIPRKPRQRIKPVAAKKLSARREYSVWIKIAMHGRHRCQKCKKPGQALEPHHPYGRSGDNLFKVVELCSDCHASVHRYPNLSYVLGWLQPEYKGVIRQPNHPQPFTLLPYP